MNESQLGALSRTYKTAIAPQWPGLNSRKKPIGIKAVAAAVIWPRKPEPDLRKADLGTLMRHLRAMGSGA